MNSANIDLHMHSTVSDGSSTPRELVHECLAAGITHAALTDHDTADGVADFLDEAAKCGLHAISGLEYNVAYDGEMHVLAYDFDINNAPLLDELELMAEQRRTRASRMVELLISKGYPITLERVKEISGGGVLGRPHIARALAEKGFGKDMEDAYKSFLEPGKPGWLPRIKIKSDRAIALAKAAGGVAVLAHPRLAHYPDYDALLTRLKAEGLDGIEVYYPAHSEQDLEYFYALSKKYDLFITQGSDYHGAIRQSTAIGKESRGGEQLCRSVQALFARR
ncbi:MAG: PHP domain-containing protein [Christensenellaceae bacterium]|nr:PHP domain-containing protein [Christensenellaceae bacterium]